MDWQVPGQGFRVSVLRTSTQDRRRGRRLRSTTGKDEGKTPSVTEKGKREMAKNEGESKNMSATGLTQSLRAVADTMIPDIEEGTILRINIEVEDRAKPGGYDVLTYAALWVNDTWYLTGEGRVLTKTYKSTLDLIAALARARRSTIEIADTFEVVR